MSAGYLIRDAIYDRLAAPLTTNGGYRKTRKVPAPPLTANDLPALSVFVLQGKSVPDGDDNVGEPHFEDTDTIGISVCRGFDDPVVLEGVIDVEVDGIKQALLTDASFVRFPSDQRKVSTEVWAVGDRIYWDRAASRATKVATGNVLMGLADKAAANPSSKGSVDFLFEGITSITRQWLFPKDGETYFIELRLEMSFRRRSSYPPANLNPFEQVTIDTRLTETQEPPFTDVIDLPQ